MKKYIGLDAHSSTCTFCVTNKEGVIEDTAEIVTNGRLLVDYVRGIPGKKELTFEECELSSWLYEILRKEVDKVVVCNPVENRKYKKAKTDKIDAKNLASLLRGNFLKEVYHNGSEKEKLRDLMSGYQDLIEEIVRVKNRYKLLFRKEGKRKTGRGVYRDESLLEGLEREDFKFIGKQWFGLLEVMEKSRKSFVKEIKKESNKHKEIGYLVTLTGIGEINAAKIVAQVIDAKRFRTKYKYYSYCGLVRHRQISGGKVYGDKKIWGNRVLKSVYKTAAEVVLKGKSGLRRYYDGMREKGNSHKNAKNAVARKIAGISLAMMKKGEKYREEIITNDLDK